MEFWQLIAIGIATGIVSAFIGVGGGFFMVPILYTIFPELPSGTVIGTSLGVITLNASYNVHLYQKKGLTADRLIWIPMVPGLLLGAIAGSQTVLHLSNELARTIFGAFLLLIALRMIFEDLLRKKSKLEKTPNVSAPLSLFLGFLAGFASGLTGLGGGVILIPIFLLIFKLSGKQAPYYSNILMVYGALAGVLRLALADVPAPTIYPQWQLGHINALLIGNILLGSFASSRIGIVLSLKASDLIKRIFFVALLLYFAYRMLFGTE